MKFNVIFLFAAVMMMTTACSDDDDKSGLFSGNDISGKVSLARDTQTKEATLNVGVSGEWKLYAGQSVETINFKEPVLTGNTQGDHPLNVSTSSRTYFQLVSTEGRAVFAERRLPISNYHFRDMGGYKTADGRYVKWGKVFRADEFLSITDDDLQYLNALPLRTIVDFRSAEEASGHPNLKPESVKSVQDLNISIGNLTAILMGMAMDGSIATVTREEIIALMCDTYRQFVTEEECINHFKTLFALLQNEENTPLVYNCSIGKDRTGIVSYLFLTSLGVSESVAMEDYLLTNEYKVADKYAQYTTMMPALKPLFEANSDFLQAAIQQIKKDHGSVEDFLTKTLSVDLAKMKKLYLY